MINLKEFKKSYISKLLNIDSYELKNNSDLKHLKDICNITTGKLNANAGSESGKYPFYTCSRKVYKINNYAFCGNDITIAGNGASIGTLHLTHGYFNAYQRTYLLYNIKVNVKYLFYVLYCLLMPEISPTFKGSAIHYMTLTALKNVYVPILPLSEQQRIVSKVYKCFLLADMIQKERDLRKKFAHDMEQSLLQQALKGDLTQQLPSDGTADDLLQKIQQKKRQLIQAGKIRKHKKLPPISKDEIPFKIPKNWRWVRFSSLYNMVGGSQPPKSTFIHHNKPGYIRLFQISDYTQSPIPTYIPLSRARKITQPNDILIARYAKGTIGKVFKAKYGAYNVAMSKIVPITFKAELDNKYLWYYFKSNIWSDFVSYLRRAVQPGFNKNDLIRLLIPVPPLSEQKRIVLTLNSLFKDKYMQQALDSYNIK